MSGKHSIQELMCSLGNENTADGSVRFESLCEIYFGAENRIRQPSFRSHVADNDNACIDTDAGFHRRCTTFLPFDTELANAPLHIDRHANASGGMVRLRFRISEEDHQTIT